jgi:esterase/lipase
MLTTSKTIVFIHGMFATASSWDAWKVYFENLGYTCHAPVWLHHEHTVEAMRAAHPNKALGKLTFPQLIKQHEEFVRTLPEAPILIGHSMGGLIAQILGNKGLGAASVSIDGAPPQGIFSFKWSFLKCNTPVLNPFAGSKPFLPSVKWYQYAFCNNMTDEQAALAHAKSAAPESRNVARTFLYTSKVDYKKERSPLLIIGGENDHIIPSSINQANYNKSKRSPSRTDFKIFAKRTHYLYNDENWEEIADYILNWLKD